MPRIGQLCFATRQKCLESIELYKLNGTRIDFRPLFKLHGEEPEKRRAVRNWVAKASRKRKERPERYFALCREHGVSVASDVQAPRLAPNSAVKERGISQGQNVRLHSLKDASMNGKIGAVDQIFPGGKYVVVVPDVGKQVVRTKNIQIVEEDPSYSSFSQGQNVRLHDLTDVSMNGKVGVVEKVIRGKYIVAIPDVGKKIFQAKNLEDANYDHQYPLDACVELTGLAEGDENAKENGKFGVIVVHSGLDCVSVKLCDDERILKVRKENLLVIDEVS